MNERGSAFSPVSDDLENKLFGRRCFSFWIAISLELCAFEFVAVK